MAAVGYTSGDPAKVDVADVGHVGGPAGPLDGSGLIPTAQIPGGGGGGGPSLAGTVTAETSYGASSAAGSATTASRGDHTHGTPALSSTAATASAIGDTATAGTGTTPARSDHVHGREAAGTPGASAVGDTAAAGSATTIARSDHRHGRESFGSATTQTTYGASSGDGTALTLARSDHTHGTPALTSSAPGTSAVGDAAAVGTATTPARADHVHGREAYGTPGSSAVGDTAAAGSATTSARSDHRHGREGFGNVTAQTSFGAASANGTATTPARSDHAHGTPAQDPGVLLRQALVPAGRVETRSRLDAGIASSTITSGTIYLVPIWLTAGTVVNSITFVSGSTTALSGGTNQWFALYDNSRVQLATTTNDTTTAWATQSTKTLAIAQVAAGSASSFTTTYTGLHYLGLMVAATTTPTILGGGASGAATQNATPGWGAADTGKTTPPAFPFTAAAPSGAGPHAYAYVS